MHRRLTRHDFNRAHWLRARRASAMGGGVAVGEAVRMVAVEPGGCAPPVYVEEPPPPPAPRPKLNLRDAPSSLELRAAAWARGAHG